MADVRSMLRAERANRRITHPNASYTSDGKLLCNLCSTPVKSEAAWGSHLHSTQHTLRLSRSREVEATRGSSTGESAGTKRKAESLESPTAPEERKRVRALDEVEEEPEEEEQIVRDVAEAKEEPPAKAPRNEDAKPDANLDSEFAAFEAEMAAMEQPTAAGTAVGSGATISAKPVTAEELAAQAREELSAQRGKRDVEIAAEKEEAARVLEDEFEEMEGLEERVKRLRERREALRKGGGGEDVDVADGVVVDQETAEEDEDDDDDEGVDDWGFGGA